MVRTRDLGCALGRIIGGALGREHSHDLDKAPQRQRPTTSARRQWEVAAITKDVHHMDDAVEEVFQ